MEYHRLQSLRNCLLPALGIAFLCLTHNALSGETWRTWNSTPTPKEGRRVENLYDFSRYVLTDYNYYRHEFSTQQPVHDAYLVFMSMNSEVCDHVIYVNQTPIFVHNKNNGKLPTYRLSIRNIDVHAFRNGGNVLWAQTGWVTFSLVLNFADGTEREIVTGPGWQMSSTRPDGWAHPDYKGTSKEAQYRLGWEGYHQGQNLYTSRPYVGLIRVQSQQRIPAVRVGETIEWEVSIPIPFYGLTKPQLTVKAVNCFIADAPLCKGTSEYSNTKNGMAFYRVRCTPVREGAYTVTFSFGPGKAMQRRLELVAFSRIPQQEVNAGDLWHSLHTTLVDKIDCTKSNPDNPVIQGHLPNNKPEGHVVKNGSLAYFQTGPTSAFLAKDRRVNYAMWKLSAKTLNQWYLVEVDVPDDKKRVQIIALVHNLKGKEYGTESTLEIGLSRPLSGKLVTHRLLFIPKFHDVRIMIAPACLRGPGEKNGAAVAAIRFYRIDGSLPAIRLGAAKRFHANYNERADLIAISFYPGSDAPQTFTGRASHGSDQYRRWYLAIHKHIEYLRISGQNAVCHGLYQYVRPEYAIEPNETDFVSLMLDMYNANNIRFFGNVEYLTSKILEGKTVSHKIRGLRVNDEQMRSGADTYRQVSRTGLQSHKAPFNNPCHPAVRADILRVIHDIAERYARHPAFKGIMIFAGTMGCAIGNFSNLNYGYSDVTYNLFRDTVRPDAPNFKGQKRFSKRYNWLHEHAWQDFLNFRCYIVFHLHQDLLRELRKYNPTAMLLVNACAWPWHGNIGQGQVADLHARLIGTGTDVRFYQNIPGMLLMHDDYMGQHIVKHDFCDAYNRNPAIWNYITDNRECGVFFWTGFYETRLFFPKSMQNPIWEPYKSFMSEKRFIGSAGKIGRNYLSSYTNAFAYANPIFFANRFTDVAEHRGFVGERAEIGQAMSFLPRGSYSTLPGSTSEVLLRQNRTGAAVIINNTWQPSQVTIAFTETRKNSARIFAPVTDQVLPWRKQGDEIWCALKLKPYELVPLRLHNSKAVRVVSIK